MVKGLKGSYAIVKCYLESIFGSFFLNSPQTFRALLQKLGVATSSRNIEEEKWLLHCMAPIAAHETLTA